MKRILYIGEDVISPQDGGGHVNRQNINILKKVFGVNFFLYHIKCRNTLKTFIDALNGYMGGLDIFCKKHILNTIAEKKIDIVFLSSSKLGKISGIIKRRFPDVQIVVFFHNIEKQYMNEECLANNTVKNNFLRNVVECNEKKTCKYADKLIVLNQRDAGLLESYYGRKADLLLPITFTDEYSCNDYILAKSTRKDELFTMLFVGSAFFANIEGIKWFIDIVLPDIKEGRLVIVGKDMDKVFTSTSNVEVFGYVQDLSCYYYHSDIVVLPIFSGGGMKTKTAEAMMYASPIIGTVEAFEGYNVDYDRIGGCFINKEEMIDKINCLKNSPSLLRACSQYSRNIFEHNYSYDSAYCALESFFMGQNIENCSKD